MFLDRRWGRPRGPGFAARVGSTWMHGRRKFAWAGLVLVMAIAPLAAAGAAARPVLDSDPDPRLYLGMWTRHVRHISGSTDDNRLIGVAVGGYFGGTFVNSYGNRAIAAGLQRDVYARRGGAFERSIGFRLGVVTGYDEDFLPIAGKVPALPMAQLLGGLRRGRFGAEAAFAGLTLSLSLHGRL